MNAFVGDDAGLNAYARNAPGTMNSTPERA